MQKVTIRLVRHSYKANQSYLLTKLERYAKEESGIAGSGSLGRQAGHQIKHPYSERLAQKGRGNVIALTTLVAYLPWKSYIQHQPASTRGAKV